MRWTKGHRIGKDRQAICSPFVEDANQLIPRKDEEFLPSLHAHGANQAKVSDMRRDVGLKLRGEGL